jgi:hypothetical protein
MLRNFLHLRIGQKTKVILSQIIRRWTMHPEKRMRQALVYTSRAGSFDAAVETDS